MFSSKTKGRFLKKDRDEEGVASTVGTIMALLVFLTFLTLFTNSYVPVWMTDNERTHMNAAMDQFGTLKGKIDEMVVMAEVTGQTNVNFYAPITLGANGIPVFASPTAGQLIYAPYGQGSSSIKVNFTYDFNGKTKWMNNLGGGMVQLYSPNRYYVEQHICYENGAIIVGQPDGQVVRAIPSLDISKPLSSSFLNVSWTQIDFIGTNTSVTGTSTAGLNLDLIYFDSQTYNNASRPTNITLTINTLYGQAWYSYLNSYLSSVTNVKHSDYWVQHNASYTTVTLRLNNTLQFTQNKAIMQLTLGLT